MQRQFEIHEARHQDDREKGLIDLFIRHNSNQAHIETMTKRELRRLLHTLEEYFEEMGDSDEDDE